MNLLREFVETCINGEPMTAENSPDCVFLNESTLRQETSGCTKIAMSEKYVTCSCTHFTLFSLEFPSYNYIDWTGGLSEARLARNPVTGIALGLFWICALVSLALAIRFDHNDVLHKSMKEQKWQKGTSGSTNTYQTIKSAFQRDHTWVGLFKRKHGASFRSMDRVLTMTFKILLAAVISAQFYSSKE